MAETSRRPITPTSATKAPEHVSMCGKRLRVIEPTSFVS